MRTIPLCLLILLGVGCEEKKAAVTATKAEPAATKSAEAAPSNVTEDELKQFFDGMLVTSNIRPPNEPAWPVGEPGQLRWLDQPLKRGWGITSDGQLKAHIDIPVEKMGRSEAWLLDYLKDWPTALKVWKRLLAENPDDLEAAINVAEAELILHGPQASVEAIRGTSGKTAHIVDRRQRFNPAQLEGTRCHTLLLTRHPKEALEACDAAIAIDDAWGSRTLAKVLLALGKNKEALVQMEQVSKMPGRMWNPGAMLTLGLAQQANGKEEEALRTWNVALARWPSSDLLKKAISGPKRSIYEWEEDESALRRPWNAKELALCGHFYLELGMKERAEVCFAASEKLAPGPALAHRLVFLGQSHPEQALPRALEAAKKSPHIDLITAVAWLYLQQNNLHEAKAWVDRALEAEPWDPKAMSLKWQVCGEEKDYVCVIEYRKRLGLPTHFNVEQYKEAKKAFQEQALRNGEHLAAKEPSSADAPKPPQLDEIVIVPLSGRTPAELEGAVDLLSSVFPGVKFSLAPPEELPQGAYKIERDQIVWDVLEERLREEPGRLYIVEQDLGAYGAGFMFAKYDLAKGRGVISLSRLRSFVGKPTSNLIVDDAVVKAVRRRLASELVAGAAKLLGLSYPCDETSCALHAHRAVTDFVLGTQPLCEKHLAEAKAMLERRGRAPAAAR